MEKTRSSEAGVNKNAMPHATSLEKTREFSSQSLVLHNN